MLAVMASGLRAGCKICPNLRQPPKFLLNVGAGGGRPAVRLYQLINSDLLLWSTVESAQMPPRDEPLNSSGQVAKIACHESGRTALGIPAAADAAVAELSAQRA